MKSKLLLMVLCISVSLTQCKDDESSPCTDNPTETLPWLKQKIQFYEQAQTDMLVFQVRYKTMMAFVIVPCCLVCNTAPTYYDCHGNEMTEVDYLSVVGQDLIWSLPTSDCGTYP